MISNYNFMYVYTFAVFGKSSCMFRFFGWVDSFPSSPAENKIFFDFLGVGVCTRIFLCFLWVGVLSDVLFIFPPALMGTHLYCLTLKRKNNCLSFLNMVLYHCSLYCKSTNKINNKNGMKQLCQHACKLTCTNL